MYTTTTAAGAVLNYAENVQVGGFVWSSTIHINLKKNANAPSAILPGKSLASHHQLEFDCLTSMVLQ